MASVSQVTSAVYQAGFQNNMSAGADAAAASMNKLSDATLTVDTSNTRANKSANQLAASLDPATKATNALATAQRNLTAAQATMATAVAAGSKNADQQSGVLATLQAKVTSAQAVVDGLSNSQKTSVVSSGQQAFALRQLAVQGTQFFSSIATGAPILTAFIQQGHQIVDVAESTGTGLGVLGVAAKAAWGFLTSPIGLALTATAAIVGIGVAAESSSRQLNAVQTTLRGFRDDYVKAANDVVAASRQIASTTQFSAADSRTAGTTIESSPNFAGSVDQLVQLEKVAGDVAKIMGTDLPTAAKLFSDAMTDPAKAAQDLADKHLFGMNEQLVLTVKNLADSGDKADAFGVILDQVSKKVSGAAHDSLTPLQQLLSEISQGFSNLATQAASASNAVLKFFQDQAAAAQSTKDAIKAEGGILLPGNITTSSTGALGLMQVQPSTAAQFGITPSMLADQGNNIFAGLSEVQRLSQLPGATTNSILGGYNLGQTGYANNPAAAAGYIGKVNAANTANLPSDVVSQINYWGQVLGLSPELIALGQRIAMVESNGQQFSGAPTLASLPLPPLAPTGAVIDVSGGSGVTNNTTLSDALKQAQSLGTISQSAQDATNAITLFKTALAQLQQQGVTSGAQFDELTQALQKEQKALYDSVPALQAQFRETDIQISGQQALSAAYQQGGAAVSDAKDAIAAQAEVIKAGIVPTMAIYATAIEAATQKQHDLTAATQDAQGQASIAQMQQNIDLLKVETDTLGEAADQRARDLAVAKQQQEIDKDRPDELQATKDAELSVASSVADMNTALQNQQNAFQAIGDLATQVFDQVGNAITNAFVNGGGASINFGNIVRSVIASVIQELSKLAILNPIINSLTGSNAATLGSVLSVTGIANDNGTGGIGSLLGLAGLGNQLGLTGSGGILTDLTSSVKSLLATPLFASAQSGASLGLVGEDSGLGSIAAGETSAGTLGGVTVGGILGGAGLGFGAGSLLGQLTPHPQNAEIGSGLGSLSGAVIGSLVPGIGTLIGGLLGGLVGSSGGLFGAPKQNAFSTTGIGISGGLLSTGSSASQIDASSLNATTAAVNELNTVLQANNVTIQSLGGISQIGTNTPGGFQDPSKSSSVSDAFDKFRFSSSNENVNTFLQGAGFGSPQELATTVGAVQNFVNALSSTDFAPNIDAVLTSMKGVGNAGIPAALASIQTFVTTTVPGLLAGSTNIGSLNTAVQQLDAQFAPAIAMAQQLGYKEADLTAARDQAAKVLTQQALDAVQANDLTLQGRYLTAAAAAGQGGVTTQQAVDYNFDVQANQQRLQLSSSLLATFGDSYKSTQDYANQMAELEQTLQEERLATDQQFSAATLQQQADSQAAQLAQQAAAQAAQLAQQQAAASSALVASNQNLAVRISNADATLSGGTPAQVLVAQLASFDATASQEISAFATNLVTSFGDAFSTTQGYANEMALEETALGQERLVIQKQYNDQIAAAAAQAAAQLAQQHNQATSDAAGNIANLATYASGLQTGSSSPLSPQAQYALASQQFNAVAGAAQQGNPTSIAQLQQYSDAFLSASRGVNGSGAGYASDFQKVLGVLGSVGSISAATLSQNTFVSETRTQTQVLNTSLQNLIAEVTALRTAVSQAQAKPARLAA